MTSEQPAVSLRGVSKTYDNHTALHETDLDIADGEFLCLLGPSGCGKTTLLNLIGGFIRPSSGAVLLGAHRVDHLPPHKRDVHTVFQSYALFPHMTVGDNVAFGLKMAKTAKPEIRRRVTDVLEMVGLAHVADRMPNALSGGQQQRVALARALVRRPSVLALDEPFGALDLNLRTRLQFELKQLHQELGITFVFVTHDQHEAMVMGDRVAIMSQGKIEQIAAPADIYLKPSSRFVAEFVGDSNIFEVVATASETRLGGLALPDALQPKAMGVGRHEVLVRPEFVQLHTSPAPGRLEVRVNESHFLGEALRLHLDVVGADTSVLARVSGPEMTTLLHNTQTNYFISWDPDRAVVLESNPSPSHAEETQCPVHL